MLLELRVNNCYCFDSPVTLSAEADMRFKKFPSNVHTDGSFHALKTLGIYGPNNSGKSCLLKCIKAIQHIFLNEKFELLPNFFTKSPVCELGVSFLFNHEKYSYSLRYNVIEKKFQYERFSIIKKDKYNNETETIWLEMDKVKGTYDCLDQDASAMMNLVGNTSLLCFMIDSDQFEYLNKIKSIISGFAGKIDFVNMNNIPLQKTIDLMKNENQLQSKVVDLIKNADLYMDDFQFIDLDNIKLQPSHQDGRSDEDVLNITKNVMDKLRLVSVYKGVSVPSLLFDSTGTKKIIALASYIIEALEDGKMLIIDELDSSLHFKLTRAIVAMFNNELNDSAQLIFTVHDISLMDCKRLFRKEQIWFTHKDNDGVYLYSLAEYTAQDGIRDTTDIQDKYRKGIIGGIPDPDLINTLLSIKGNHGGICIEDE